MQSITQARGNGQYPRYLYPDPAILGNVEPIIVNDAEEHAKAGRGYLNEYRHQDYPRTMYREGSARLIPAVIDKKDGSIKASADIIYDTRIVKNMEEERKLGKNWMRTPPQLEDAEDAAISAQLLADENSSMKEQIEALQAQLSKQHTGATK